jgi:hypothetical protein
MKSHTTIQAPSKKAAMGVDCICDVPQVAQALTGQSQYVQSKKREGERFTVPLRRVDQV